jgi:anthraniloyl-CoA monooxygenase
VKIVSIGGGPAGLYFAILMSKADPGSEIVVLERNRPDDTFGFGVVFSDATLGNLRNADPETYDEIARSFAHWDDIETHVHGEVVTSTGHGFSGLSRRRLLEILTRRAQALGVEIRHQSDVVDPETLLRGRADLFGGAPPDLVLGADGVNSAVRSRFAAHFGPSIDQRPNRFVWLGTTKPFPAFTFYFDRNEHGLFRVHAYQYEREAAAPSPAGAGEAISTFIVECTEETWRRAGLDRATEAETLAYCERLFAPRLDGHRLIDNRSIWRSFPTVTNARWSHGAVVLVGDAAHTAHFSIGSGTKLAMEDAIALRDALTTHAQRGGAGAKFDVPRALEAYERERRPAVEAVQRAAAVSLRWFEETERYHDAMAPLQFVFSMLTRSLRIHHQNLAVRDPALVTAVDRWFAAEAAAQTGTPVDPGTPPMFTPFRLRGLTVPNRIVVSPMCMYSAEEGVPSDFHLVHYGSRAMGGAGLVLTEMTDVAPDARITPGCAGLWNDTQRDAWKRIVEYVHRHTPAKIGIQIAHAGRKGATKKMWEGIDQPLDEGGWPIVAASPIPYFPHSQVPRALDRAGMVRIRDQFVHATRLADDAGFDLLELHMAHGYLLASFLSPLTNQRTDDYGGDLEGRLRYPLEVFRAVRDAWPADKPISVRISATDWIEGGFDVGDAVAVARALVAAGCDVIDVSSGQTTPESKPTYGRLYQTPFADRVRNEAKIPTMTVGNISSYGDANAILAAGRADLCVIARGHLYDPYWTRHAAFEQGYALPWPAQYGPARTFTPRAT